MKKSSLLTRLRFSYTLALLESFVATLRDRDRSIQKASLSVHTVHPLQ